MKKRFCSALLASALAIPSFVPVSAMNIMAQEVVLAEEESTELIYSHDETVTVSSGNGALTLGAEDVAKFAALTNATFEATVKLDNTTGVQSLLFVGDSTQNSHYASAYIYGNKLGFEVLDNKNGNAKYSEAVELTGVDFTEEHRIAVTFDSEGKILFYVDGEQVYEAALGRSVINGIITDVDYVGFGNGKRASGNNYPMSGTISKIKVFSDVRTADEIKADQSTEPDPAPVDTDMIYVNDPAVTVTNGSGALALGEEDVAKFAALTNATFEATVKLDNTTGVQSLLFVGDSTQNSHYASVYIYGNKLGFEVLDNKNGNAKYSEAVELTGVNFTEEHRIAVTFDSEGKILFYVDGEQVYEAALGRSVINGIITDVDYVGFGNGKRASGNNYPMSGTISKIKVFSDVRTADEIKADQPGNTTEPDPVEPDPAPVTDAIYAHDPVVTVNNGSGALTLDSADVAKIADLTSMTFEASAKSSSTGLQTLFFVGDSTQNTHYISVYMNSGRRLGIECQDKKNGTTTHYHTYVDTSGINFAEEHLYAVTFEANSKIVFYIDGEKVHEATVSKNFVKDVLTGVDYVGFGNGNRAGGGNNYPMTGTISNIRIYGSSRTAEQIRADQLGGIATGVYTSSAFNAQSKTSFTEDADTISSVKDMTEGSWSARFRMDGTSKEGLQYLASLSDGTTARNFASLYVMKSGENWVAGIDAPDKNTGGNVTIPADTDITDGHWHDLLAVREGTAWTMYLDGESIGSFTTSAEGMFNVIPNPTTLATGFTQKENGNNPGEFHGSIASTTIYTGKINAVEAKIASNSILSTGEMTADLTNAYITDKVELFGPGYDGSSAYRIPSMITTSEGTVLVGIDKRNSGLADQGNIDFVVKRMEAGETSFGQPIVVSDMLDGGAGKKSAVMIDSILLQDTDENSPHKGRIHAVMDMFTQSNAAMELGNQAVGNEYLKVGDKSYRKIYNDAGDLFAVVEEDGIGAVYTTVTENGATVLGEKTDYTVTLHAPAPYTQIGNLYKAGEYKGNIFMNEAGENKGELHMKKTMSIWHFYSDDDGKTWSEPQDLSPMIKADWMQFCGTGPGRGVQLQNGRLVFPIYTCNSVGLNSQASAIIVSDDWGETWVTKSSPNTLDGLDRETMSRGTIYTECQPVQLRNGDLLLFMRTQSGKVKYAVSKDNGESWDHMVTTDIPAVYCQYSAITYVDKDDTEWVIVANPSGPTRENGKITRGKVLADGSIDWEIDKAKLIEPTGYAYSCLTEIAPAEDGTKRFADFYELNNTPFTLVYVEFDENYMAAGNVPVEETAPKLENISAVQVEGGKIRVTADTTQRVFYAGAPALEVTCGSETVTLPLKSATETSVVFEGSLPAGFAGVVTLKGVDTANGELSNMNGLKPVVEEQKLLDTTEFSPAAIVSYTSQHTSSTAENTDGAAVNIIDGNTKTYWHSNYNQAFLVMPQQVTMDLGKEVKIDQMNFLNRQSSTNAICKEFRLEGSTDGENFTLLVDSEMANTQKWQSIPFEATTVRYVRFSEDSNYQGNNFATVAEITFNVAVEGVERKADKTALNKMIDDCKALQDDSITSASWDVFKTVLDKAEALKADDAAGQSAVDAMVATLRTESRKLADKTSLAEDLSEYADLKKEDFAPAEWAAFEEALNEATTNLDSYTTQRDVENAIMKLKHLRSTLQPAQTTEPDPVPELDYTLLNAAIAKADDITLSLYSNGAALNAPLSAARTALTDADTQAKVDKAANDLNEALLALRRTPSKEALGEISE